MSVQAIPGRSPGYVAFPDIDAFTTLFRAISQNFA